MTPKDRRSAFEDGVLAGFAFACNFASSGVEHGVPLQAVAHALQMLATTPECAAVVADYSDEVREMYSNRILIDEAREADRAQSVLTKLMRLLPHTHDEDPPINLNELS